MAIRKMEARELEGMKINGRQVTLVQGDCSLTYGISYEGASLLGRVPSYLSDLGKWVTWGESSRHPLRGLAINLAHKFSEDPAMDYDEIDQSEDSPPQKHLFT